MIALVTKTVSAGIKSEAALWWSFVAVRDCHQISVLVLSEFI